MSPPDPFDAATFYDCNEDAAKGEGLCHDSPEAAVAKCLSLRGGVDGDVEFPLVVYAWAPEEILAPWFDSIAAQLHDIAVAAWEADFGDPEDGDSLPPKVADELLVEMTTAIRVLKKARPWRCHKVASREYTCEQVLVIVGGEST